MNHTWNAAQYSAIHARNPNLLVSASAGTGKTEVMTERIADMVAHEGLNISRVLVVTFTKAAAAEMRSRVTAKLREAAEMDFTLRPQLELMATAAISTIDALCQRIVRSHFEAADIDPSFTVMDSGDSLRLSADALAETMEEMYAGASRDEELSALTAKFSDRELERAIGYLARYLESLPDPEDFCRRYGEKIYTPDTLEEEPFAKIALEEARRRVRCAAGELAQAQDLLEKGRIDMLFAQNIAEDGDIIGKLLYASRQEDESLFRQALKDHADFPRKAPVKKGTLVDGVELFDKLRKDYKSKIKAAEEYAQLRGEKTAADLNAMQPALRGLCKITLQYRSLFWQKKAQRRQADFGDIQRLALQLLRDEKLGPEIAGAYDAVFVDECQDVSPMQEELLSRLQRPGGSSFWVGDVKQSIYRFRQADAALFERRRLQCETDEFAPRRCIYLCENYRSVGAVHDAVNRVFRHVMRAGITGLDYDATSELTCSQPTLGDLPAEIHVFPKKAAKDAHLRDEEVQMRWVARDIRRRVESGLPMPNRDGTPGKPLRYGDVLILTPVAGGGVMHNMESVLHDEGVPCVSNGGTQAAASIEVRQVLAFVECIMNERDDYALLATLRSPFLRFTDEELVRVRLCLNGKNDSFRMALEEEACSGEEPLRTKCAQAIELLRRERFYAENSPVFDYLWDLLDRSGYLVYVGGQPGGAQRQANLEYLCAKAADWDARRSEDICAFVSTMRQKAESGDMSCPSVNQGGSDAVELMTIHHSKGLGARVVYVIMLNKDLAGGGHMENPAYLSCHKDIGLSLRYRNEQARVERDTELIKAVKLADKNEEKAEKARVLYVAMTRAKERLVLCGSMDGKDNPEAIMEELRSCQNEAGLENAKTYLDWLLQSTSLRDPVLEDGDWEELWQQLPGATEKHRLYCVFHLNIPKASSRHRRDSGEVRNALSALLPPGNENGFSPARGEKEADPLVPVVGDSGALRKIGVTTLLRYRDDISNIPWNEPEGQETREQKRQPLYPRKLRVMAETPSAPKLLVPSEEEETSAMKRGTLTHMLLELIDLENLRCLTGDMKHYVDWEVDRMISRRQFSPEEAALIDTRQVADFFQSPLGRRILDSILVRRELGFTMAEDDPPRTLVQGIIDLCFVEGNAWVLVDFKTDRVEKARELIPRYRMQIEYYRRALEKATGMKVKQALLYSLRLREAVEVEGEEGNRG